MTQPPGAALPTGRAGWAGVRVVVHGFDESMAGVAATDNLLFLGASVTALDEAAVGQEVRERAELLRTLGATIRLEAGATSTLPGEVDLVIDAADDDVMDLPRGGLLQQADERGVPVWSDAELAWRLRDDDAPPWLLAAGEDDDLGVAFQVAELTASMALSAGLRANFAGTGGVPLVEAVMDPEQSDVLCVGLTARQLAHSTSIAAESAVVLGHAPVLAGAYERVRVACVYVDEVTERFVMDAEVAEGARAIGLTLDMPAVSMLGVVENILVDRAFIAERQTSAAELATLDDLDEVTPTTVREHLAAAALARAHGLSQAAVRDGIRGFNCITWGGDEHDDE